MSVTSLNAQTRRVETIWYPTEEEALSTPFEKSPNYLDLNGIWDFAYFDSPDLLPEALRNCPEIDGIMSAQELAEAEAQVKWGEIKVPGNWEHQGHGVAIYVNQPYEFAPKNPQPPLIPDQTPVGIYRRAFKVPENWDGREIYLNLCGAKSGVYVYVNGQVVGYCEDSKDLARFDITSFLRKGDNELLLKIYRWSTGSYLECQDFWRISGIERDVYLSSESTDRDFNFSVSATLDDKLTTGILSIKTEGHGDFSYKLLDKDGSVVATSASGKTVRIPSPRLWTAETPELYTLLLKVDGEYTRFNVGFRQFKIVKNRFLVNGKAVKFKGVNMHEHNEYTGHYNTRKDILTQLLLMKEFNINAIRTCHYPQPRAFYELCDSLGFYVYDEANIESHGMGYKPERTLGNKPEWYAKHLDRILNMYYRTANYPCVTLLSLGNEAGNGVNFYNAYRELKALEEKGQNRPVVYERAEYDWNTDLIVPQYPGAEWFRRMGETFTERPVCPSEYSHAMGNSNGSLDWQWEQIYAYKQLQGAFIWDWVDQGLYDRERGWTYGGDYGVNAPSDDNFCCNGIVNPDREPHPAFYEVKHVYQNVSVTPVDSLEGVFSVFNRHYFTDLGKYKLRYWVERDGKRPFWWLRRSRRFRTAPQTAEEFRVKLPRMKRPGEYRIFFEVTDGSSVVACDEYLLKNTSVPKEIRSRGKLSYTEGDTRIVVRGKNVELVFDKASGCVVSWQVKGADAVLPGFGVQPNFWRAPTDNDYGNRAPRRLEEFRTLQKPAAVRAAAGADGTVVITVKGNGVRAEENWTVFPDGTLRVEVTTAPSGDTEIPRLGLRFHVADDAFSYFGKGPVENYWDRSSGASKRIWKASAREEYFPYVRPQETGHHSGTSWLRIGKLSVRSTEEFEFNALRQTVEDLDGGLTKSQTHISDVPVRDFTEVCIDYRMTGVGGYDSWGALPEKARSLWANQSYTYCFILNYEK